MQSTSITSWHTGYNYYPVPQNLLSHHLHLSTHKPKFPQNQCTNHTLITLHATHSCSKEQDKKQNQFPHNNNRYPDRELQDFYSSIETLDSQLVESEEASGSGKDIESGISSNMWWTDFKAALGQRINVEGIVCSVGILAKDRQLVIPHVSVPDIRHVDWVELKNRGFKGVVFDKDNTLTVPYSLRSWPPLKSSIEQCKSLFGNNMAVFSNSAGLHEYDPDGRKARALEHTIGIKVIRHQVKKPAGTAEEIESLFGCESSRLIMVGDRPFTDIVYGNKNGFFTILTEPLSVAEEPMIVRQVRRLEVAIVRQWTKKGLKPISHKLLPDPEQSVKDVPLSS